ncbi:MAG TPA: SRPBCC family protein [Acidimicrobiales bacterium]|nr:SRPBCC family protein [Acidimicrobiales bacterium]
MDHDLGTLAPAGDRWTLTFTRTLAHPPDKVWRAVTEDEHLAAWFPQTIVGERRAGAALRFVTSDDGDEGFDGEMVVFEPPHVLEMRWGDDVLRLELAADGAGTRLTLVDTFAELGKAARDAAGWHECLLRLAVELDGGDQPPWGDTWAQIHPAYVADLGPEASTIGPPEGAATSS